MKHTKGVKRYETNIHHKRRNIMSILTILFLGFTALIVVCQLVPAVILFVGMMKGLFSTKSKKSTSKGV